MNCPDCTTLLHDQLDGELAPADIRRLEAHLAGCPACRAQRDRLQALRAAATRLPREMIPARNLWPAIAARISPAAGAPRRGALHRFIPLALAASIAVLAWFAERRAALLPRGAGWTVASVAGTPSVAARTLAGQGELRLGQWLETDARSRARLAVGTIGEVSVEPNSRLRLTGTGATDHRLELARGTLSALIWAPPRLFFVDTPAATAVDLGCAYTLTVDDRGGGELAVTAGFVALEHPGREALVPAGAVCLTRRGAGPGTPFAKDASAALRAALERFDFAPPAERAAALGDILSVAGPGDGLTLWHLLARAPEGRRGDVYDLLARHHAPPGGVTRAGIVAGDAAMRRAWAGELGFGVF